VVEAGAGQGGARDGPFIGARGEGSNGVRCTPVRCTAMELMVYSGGDETLGGAMPCKDATTSARTRRCRTSLCGECRRGGGEDDGRR
jgi:hypothetical protein